MTPDQERAIIAIIRAEPQRHGLIALAQKAGAKITDTHELLVRGERAGRLVYADDGPGARGWTISAEWQVAA